VNWRHCCELGACYCWDNVFGIVLAALVMVVVVCCVCGSCCACLVGIHLAEVCWTFFQVTVDYIGISLRRF
jgi:hypothetical protein